MAEVAERCNSVMVFCRELGHDALAATLKRCAAGCSTATGPRAGMPHLVRWFLVRFLFEQGFKTLRSFRRGARTAIVECLAHRRRSYYQQGGMGGGMGGGGARACAAAEREAADRIAAAAGRAWTRRRSGRRRWGEGETGERVLFCSSAPERAPATRSASGDKKASEKIRDKCEAAQKSYGLHPERPPIRELHDRLDSDPPPFCGLHVPAYAIRRKKKKTHTHPVPSRTQTQLNTNSNCTHTGHHN